MYRKEAIKMGHNHKHHHLQDSSDLSGQKIFWVTFLNVAITITEVLGGLFSGSLALLSDSLHNLSDTISIVLSFAANKISSRPRSTSKTFGYKRAEILAAFINSAVLLGISLWLILEAWHRFQNPEVIDGTLMLIVATIGLVANLLSVFLLENDSRKNMNIKSSYLHLISDTVSSFGVILGGIAIKLWGISWIDPLITLLISLYIIRETWSILKKSTDIFMQGSPKLDYERIKEDVEKLDGVKNIHHIHCWMLNESTLLLEAHVDMDDMLLSRAESIYCSIEHILKEHYGISHVTLQAEVNFCDDKEMF